MRPMLSMCLMLLAAIAISTDAMGQSSSADPNSDTYEWSAELVSFADGVATVKARLVDDDAAAQVMKFKPGARVLVQWSGVQRFAYGIREVLPSSSGQSKTGEFLLPVELGSSDAPDGYVTFRIRMPAASAELFEVLKPGEWITVRSSHKAAAGGDAVVAVRAYYNRPKPQRAPGLD